jgi:uncharacterized protein (TIGR00369 family)
MSALPEKLVGYRETKLIDPFEQFVGPLYEIGEGIARRYALIVDERHVNMRGVIHGGMLMTLADMTLGQAVWDACDHAACVTLSMQTQFLKGVHQGDILEVTPQLSRKTRSMIFIRGDYQVAGETVFTASSVWKLLGTS